MSGALPRTGDALETMTGTVWPLELRSRVRTKGRIPWRKCAVGKVEQAVAPRGQVSRALKPDKRGKRDRGFSTQLASHPNAASVWECVFHVSPRHDSVKGTPVKWSTRCQIMTQVSTMDHAETNREADYSQVLGRSPARLEGPYRGQGRVQTERQDLAHAFVRVCACSAVGFLGQGGIGQFKPKERGFGDPTGVLSKAGIRHKGTGRWERLAHKSCWRSPSRNLC